MRCTAAIDALSFSFLDLAYSRPLDLPTVPKDLVRFQKPVLELGIGQAQASVGKGLVAQSGANKQLR
jgi:hypothetical protein